MGVSSDIVLKQKIYDQNQIRKIGLGPDISKKLYWNRYICLFKKDIKSVGWEIDLLGNISIESIK